MNQPSQHDWNPDPQLLAAYFDGEVDDVALRARIEMWLEAHPEAGEEWAELKKLMRDTAPPEPSEAAWKRTREHIDTRCKRPVARRQARRPWYTAAVVAASVVLFVGILFGGSRLFGPMIAKNGAFVERPQPRLLDDGDFEVLPVALASEVTILRIDGADVDAVVVGEMPVSGSLELADPGEVCIKCKCPRVGVCQDATNRPMVWAIASAD